MQHKQVCTTLLSTLKQWKIFIHFIQLGQKEGSCYYFCTFEAGLALIIGTFVNFNVIQLLLGRGRKSTKTTIQVDELVLVEQCVNLINGPLIFLQLLHLSIPAYTKQIFESFVFCSVRHLLLRIAIYHRAIGGLGIAGVRVLCISFPYFVIRVGANKLVKCTCGLTW